MILGIVAGLIALVVIVGFIIAGLAGRNSAGSTIEPGTGVPSAQGPQQQPTEEPTDEPSSEPSGRPSDKPTSSGSSGTQDTVPNAN